MLMCKLCRQRMGLEIVSFLPVDTISPPLSSATIDIALADTIYHPGALFNSRSNSMTSNIIFLLYR